MTDLSSPTLSTIAPPANPVIPQSSWGKRILAAFLSPVLPGVGHLLIHRRRTGFFLLLFFTSLLLLCWPLREMKQLGGTLLFGAGMIVLCIFSTCSAGYEPGGQKEKPSQWWLAILLPFAFLAAIGHINWATHASGFQVFLVPSGSMEKTVMRGNRVMVDRWHYRQNQPSDGDIVAFTNAEGIYLLKRVIARGGETIEGRNGEIFIDGKQILEPYAIHSGYAPPEMNSFGPTTIPEGKLFVMGDNRDISLDSRNPEIGPIDVAAVSGKALYTIGTFTDKTYKILE